MLSLTEALATYPENVRPLPVEQIPLTQALHRVLREPAVARCDLPRFSQSALDGYVLTNEDAACAPCTLKISGSISAGDSRALSALAQGECQRILTGARVPPGAGAVVAQERVSVTDGLMTLPVPLKPGANIRWQAEEQREGATLGTPGQRLTPGLIAALATAGVDVVNVTRTPRIVVLVSGDEVQPLGTPLAEGQIWDSNGPLVLAWLQARGYAASAQHLPDTRSEVEQSLKSALDHADLVITTGGVSVGDKDYILPVAESLGVQRVFWQVAQKPGKPIYFGVRPSPGPPSHPLPPGEGLGVRENTLLLGLPGNPAAVLIGLTLHVRAVLDQFSAVQNPGAHWHKGLLAAAVKADSKRDGLLRMQLHFGEDGVVRLQPLPHQDSHMLSNLGATDVLVWTPARETSYAAGENLRWTYL